VKWLAATIVLLSLSTAEIARADCIVDRDIVRCAAWQVDWLRPEGWELSEQASYPGLLVAAVHKKGGGRMTLAAEKLSTPDETVQHYAARNRTAMKNVGFKLGLLTHHATGALVQEVVAADGVTRVRQGFFVHDGYAYVITLAAPAETMHSYVRAFDDALRNVSFRGKSSTTQP
jgi:hypothetical protein